MTLLNITDNDVYTGLVAFMAAIVPSGTPVLRGQQDRVPMPAVDCIILTTIGAPERVGTNVDELVATGAPSPATGFNLLMTSDFQYSVQADFYSPLAESWAIATEILWRDKAGFALMPDGMKPLYSEGRQQLPLVGAENQWIQRWTLTLFLDYQPTLTLPVQAATTATVIPEPLDVFSPV